jgi:transposase
MHIMDKRVTSGAGTRRRHSSKFKRELVERSLEPGASVAAIAQENGINANLLFNWRRLHQRDQAAIEPVVAATLLPVTVQARPQAQTTKTIAPRTAGGVIEIDVGSTRVRLRGAVDEASVRCVLRLLGVIA